MSKKCVCQYLVRMAIQQIYKEAKELCTNNVGLSITKME